ncbi:MAG: glycosyl hydrolase [Alteromonadaceae bacterium]|nr:glycosyl hydrolase [Alteromonadaceae bacterium]
MITRRTLAAVVVSVGTLLSITPPAYALKETVKPELFDKMEYRFIGPYRGGRSVAVSGVEGNTNLYFMGTAGGGVWKTDDAGLSWQPLSDTDFAVGSIGSIAVAPSDPNVIYVGTGEGPIRGVTTSHGKGVYKSTDGGETWKLVGLDTRGQIPKIRIHPNNPDVAWAAVQGNIWAPNEERGIFKTTDGGETWQHVLKVNADTGAADLAIDPTNPRILYASMWHHGRTPWFIKSGGEGGGLYKSTDGGESWNKLENGLPELIGKVGIDIAASNPKRLYAIVEADKGGLYRSDDAGKSWQLMNGDNILKARAWYYNHIKVDPNDENTLYVMNVQLHKSIDGGKTFEIKSLPHGDTHDMWINPDNSLNMINANDGGATVTFDGGDSWSTIYNQPTAQFYRVITDNLDPYYVYGGQQDNTTMATPSATWDSGISIDEQFAVGGGESAHIAFDADNPKLIYATTINGTLTEYNRDNGLTRPIMPYPEYVFGRNARDQKYRTNWNAPVLVSQHDPDTVYYGTQMILKTTDRGVNWQEISPDLTRNDPEKQGLNGGPITNEQAGAEYYNTVFYIAESPANAGELWVGADDGKLHLTRNEGKNWQDITPHKKEAQVNAIELSPHAQGKAYVAVTGYKLNDYSPYIYKTENYGKRWKRIDDGLPEDAFVRVVREDAEREGMLFAGTENGMFVSFDDGDNWQKLDLNLPPVAITDMTVKGDDLVVATQGRGFWILDDISPLREVHKSLEDETLFQFEPVDGVRLLSGGSMSDQPQAGNPPRGVTFRYYLKDKLEEQTLRIDIFDADNQLVRTLSSTPGAFEKCAKANEDVRSPVRFSYPSTHAGYNEFIWDLRRAPLNCIDNVKLFGGWKGARVMPGDYKAKMSVGELTQTRRFKVLPDPREEANAAQLQVVEKSIQATETLLNDLFAHLQKARSVRSQLNGVADTNMMLASEVSASIDRIVSAIDDWESLVIQPKHQTFEDDINWPNMLDRQVRFLMDNFDRTGAPAQAGAIKRLNDLEAQWQQYKVELETLFSEQVKPLNEKLSKQGAYDLESL